MAWFEIVKEFLERFPGVEFSAPDIVDTLYPNLSNYNRTMTINKVNQALNTGLKFGFFEKLELRDRRRYWRISEENKD